MHRVGNIGTNVNFVFDGSFHICTIDVSKCENKCQSVLEDYIPRLQTSFLMVLLKQIWQYWHLYYGEFARDSVVIF